MCDCKIICDGCARPLIKCEDCGQKFKQDARYSNFHQRLAERLRAPCKHSCHGCEYMVAPHENHEIHCLYEPVACARCKLLVSKNQMKNHFLEEHCLRSINLDVKFEEFYFEESTGSREIKCVTKHGHKVYISLLNVGEFNKFHLVYQPTDTTISLKLEFIIGVYMHLVIDSKTPNSTDGILAHMSSIEIDKGVFNDWVSGVNTLNITVTERKKRQCKGTADNAATSMKANNKENSDVSANLMINHQLHR